MRRPAPSTVSRYLARLASQLGLTDWELETKVADLPDDIWAHAGVNHRRSYALIEISPGLFAEPALEQRQVITHELLHLHLAALDWSHKEVAGHLGVRARRLADEVWEQRSERACDDLARVVAPMLPLPPWCR